MPPQSRKETIRRLEFISNEEAHVNSAVAQLYVLADRLGADVIKFQPAWDDEEAIEQYLANVYVKLMDNRADLVNQMLTSVKQFMHMGVTHTVLQADEAGLDFNAKDVFDESNPLFMEKMTLDDPRGKGLSQRIWTDDEAQRVMREAEDLIRARKSAFEVAEALKKFITEDRPRWMVERLANTELARAYADARVEGAYELQEQTGEQVYVQVSLSPMHPKPDICDEYCDGGTAIYKLEDAVLPPFHPNCICRHATFVPSDRWTEAQYSRSVTTPAVQFADARADTENVRLEDFIDAITDKEARMAGKTGTRPYDTYLDAIEILANRDWSPESLAKMYLIKQQLPEDVWAGQGASILKLMEDQLGTAGIDKALNMLGRTAAARAGKVPEELKQLAVLARKYKTADDFYNDFNMESMMDLSSPEKDRYGRIFYESADGGFDDVVETNKKYGSQGNDAIRGYPSANVPITTDPQERVTIYRSATKSQKEILPGDWVSFSKEYAASHARGHVLSKTVQAQDVIWAQADFNEWIYSPHTFRDLYPGGLIEFWDTVVKK